MGFPSKYIFQWIILPFLYIYNYIHKWTGEYVSHRGLQVLVLFLSGGIKHISHNVFQANGVSLTII